MRTWMESGLVMLIGAAWAAFLLVLALGPGRGERLVSAWWGRAAEEGRSASAEAGAGTRLLRKDEVVRLPGRGDATVLVEAGLVLVTREGDPEDHVLGPGDAFPLGGRGLALAWALESSQITLRPLDDSARVASPAAAR